MKKFAVPELFLGLLALAIAAIVTAILVTSTLRDIRHTGDTVTVTASAKKPISADLVKWPLDVSAEEKTAPPAAAKLRADVAAVRDFLRRGGIPANAVSASVVTAEPVVIQLPKHQRLTRFRVSQEILVSTSQIDVVERVSSGVTSLIERGVGVAPQALQYLSTELTQAKLDALGDATKEARRRAEILVGGGDAKLGRLRSSSLGVYQVTPRDSTDVSDYGINDTSSREKDVNAVVTVTFDVTH